MSLFFYVRNDEVYTFADSDKIKQTFCISRGIDLKRI